MWKRRTNSRIGALNHHTILSTTAKFPRYVWPLRFYRKQCCLLWNDALQKYSFTSFGQLLISFFILFLYHTKTRNITSQANVTHQLEDKRTALSACYIYLTNHWQEDAEVIKGFASYIVFLFDERHFGKGSSCWAQLLHFPLLTAEGTWLLPVGSALTWSLELHLGIDRGKQGLSTLPLILSHWWRFQSPVMAAELLPYSHIISLLG